MAFIKFEGVRSQASNFISITQSNSFGFGGEFMKKHNLGDKDYVELYFDPGELKIGFKFSNDAGSSKYKLIKTKHSESKSIVSRSFFNKHLSGIEIKQYINRYPPQEVHDSEHGTLYVIKLEKKNKTNEDAEQQKTA